jgi:hypothetical protein
MLDCRLEGGLEGLDRNASAIQQRAAHSLRLADESKQKMLGLYSLLAVLATEVSSLL